MRFLMILTVLFSASAFAAYDKTWYQAEYWSGEWPNGFSVHQQGVVVPARTAMDLDVKPSINCALPYKAVFNPWNTERYTLSEAKYQTASKIVNLTAKSTFSSTMTDGNGSDVKVQFKKGQVFEYLIYGSEGSFLIRVKGKEYWAGQDLFKKLKPMPKTAEQQEWLRLKCEGGEVAFIYTADLFTATDKDGNKEYLPGLWNASIGNPGVVGYGEARDLTDDEVKNGKP